MELYKKCVKSKMPAAVGGRLAVAGDINRRQPAVAGGSRWQPAVAGGSPAVDRRALAVASDTNRRQPAVASGSRR